jgi:hypothetical protein
MAPVVVVLSRHTPSGYQAGIDERSGLDEGLGYYVAGVVGNERASDHLCNFQPIIFHYIKGWANLLAWLRTYNSIAEFSESPAKSEPIGSGNIRNRIDTTCNHVKHRLQDPLGIPGNFLLLPPCGVMMTDYAHPGYISIVSIGAWIGVGLVGFLFRNQDISLMWIFLFSSPSNTLSSSAANAIVYQRSSLCSGYLWVVATMTISIFLWLASLLCRRFVMLGRNLLLLYRTGHEGQFQIDYAACLCLVFFFSTLIATLFWYGHMYDSYGTTVPVWTGVFG